MELQKDILIVSAFGRGQWLTQRLQQMGWKVALVDVSGRLGRWAPEDWEGPFGFFDSPQLQTSQRARLLEDEETLNCSRGFTLWLKEGPLELKSALTQYLVQKHGVPELVKNHLMEKVMEFQPDHASQLSQIRKMTFAESWLAQLAHQWSSSRFRDHTEALKHGTPLPLFSPFVIRRPSRVGYEKSLQFCADRGAHVLAQASVEDMEIDRKSIHAMEVRSATSGVMKSKHFVWLLTSEETYFMNEKLGSLLFPQGALKPLWVWSRFRMSIEGPQPVPVLPDHWTLIDDLHLPWTHENMVIGVRTPYPSQFDCWMRLPVQKRFQREYLDTIKDRLIDNLKRRLPDVQVRVEEMPQEYLYSEEELGPSRFPVYSPETIDRLRPAKLNRFWLSQAETMERLDWLAQLQAHQELAEKLDEQLKLEKGDTSDRTLHP